MKHRPVPHFKLGPCYWDCAVLLNRREKRRLKRHAKQLIRIEMEHDASTCR